MDTNGHSVDTTRSSYYSLCHTHSNNINTKMSYFVPTLNMNMGLGTIKKNIGAVGGAVGAVGGAMGASLHQLSATAVAVGQTSQYIYSGTDDKDKRKEKEQEEKRRKGILMSQVLPILEDVRLQCPQTHSGLIVAYTGTTLSPIIHPSVKFTWFRMSPSQSFLSGTEFQESTSESQVQMIEEVRNAWYAPTVDDIGCIICAQCEDNFDQGFSRYVECGPIKADSLLSTLAESAVEHGIYETKAVCVSLGLDMDTESVNAISVNGDIVAADSDPSGEIHSHSSSSSGIPKEFQTVLSSKGPFLQLNGRSSIEVDESGIFISIPTLNTQTVPSTQGNNGANPSLSPIRGNPASKTFVKKSAAVKRATRRGLRIPVCGGIKVSCVQPLSLVMTLPITRKALLVSDSTPTSLVSPQVDTTDWSSSGGEIDVVKDDKTPDTANDSSDSNLANNVSPDEPLHNDEEKSRMQRFLSSSILAIPWTYEGCHHSPEAYAGDNFDLTAEERQQLIKEAEEEAIVLANTVCALAEFISSLPEGTTELKICFSCSDRIERDTLAIGIRSLICLPSHYTRIQRMQATFPWLYIRREEDEIEQSDTVDGDASDRGFKQPVNSLLGISTESEMQTKRRLKQLEDETVNLRRERNELSLQLLQSREEILKLGSERHEQHVAPPPSGHQITNPNLASSDDDGGNNPANAQEEQQNGNEPQSQRSISEPNPNPQQPESEVDAQQQRQLLSKVIELENKANINAKREAEMNRQLSEIEARNSKMQSETDRLRAMNEELSSRLAAAQALYDRQSQTIQLLEDDQQRNKGEISTMTQKLNELGAIEQDVAEKERVISNLREEITHTVDQLSEAKSKVAEQDKTIDGLRLQREDSNKEFTKAIDEKDLLVSQLAAELSTRGSQLACQSELLAERDRKLSELGHVNAELREEKKKVDALQGEIKHLQRKSESQTQELRKSLRENAAALAEFEKALVRKSEECNDLYFKINKLKDEAAAAKAAPFGEHGIFATAIVNTLIPSASAAAASMSRGSSHSEQEDSNASSSGGVFGGLLRKLNISGAVSSFDSKEAFPSKDKIQHGEED